MQQIYYELGVLAKSVHFKNLSGAAMHVGLSQPQLSRIIMKIEEELKIVLLDRSAKRKSGWTPVAYELSNMFEKSIKRLEGELMGFSQNQMIGELHIGTLEGLSSFAMDACQHCFTDVGVSKIFIEIYDLNELEAHFMSGNLDLIFTSKSPGRQKFKFFKELGFQVLEKIQTDKDYAVLSSFEYGRAHKKEFDNFKHVLITNSLAMRREWFSKIGGTGFLPTEAKRGKAKEHEPVYMIGSEILNPKLWQQMAAFVDKEK
ncbi:MAG: LysR family transcriptional regulator [Bdellovibrionaceae bacterium]|nr:LysR family transcriptional regulator [Bdellovibrio sp.]